MTPSEIDVAVVLSGGAEQHAANLVHVMSGVDAALESGARDAATVAAVISATGAAMTLVTELIRLRSAIREQRIPGAVVVESVRGTQLDLLSATDADIERHLAGYQAE